MKSSTEKRTMKNRISNAGVGVLMLALSLAPGNGRASEESDDVEDL